jgi:hypothetical protein
MIRRRRKYNENQEKVQNGKAVAQSGNPDGKTTGTPVFMAWLGLHQCLRGSASDLDLLGNDPYPHVV